MLAEFKGIREHKTKMLNLEEEKHEGDRDSQEEEKKEEEQARASQQARQNNMYLAKADSEQEVIHHAA